MLVLLTEVEWMIIGSGGEGRFYHCGHELISNFAAPQPNSTLNSKLEHVMLSSLGKVDYSRHTCVTGGRFVNIDHRLPSYYRFLSLLTYQKSGKRRWVDIFPFLFLFLPAQE